MLKHTEHRIHQTSLLDLLKEYHGKVQRKSVIRTSSGVEENVLMTDMFLYPVFL